MKVEIWSSNFTVDDIRANSDKLFVFEDNNARVGLFGQSLIRNQPNSIGLRVRKGPGTRSAAFYSDLEIESNKKNILDDILLIKSKSVNYKFLVLAKDGYGNVDLKNKAPKTYQFLEEKLKNHFDFDNNTCKNWFKIPSHSDIVNSEYINFSKNSEILLPTNNSFFRDDYLQNGLLSNYDMIKSNVKQSFTYKKDLEIGRNVILQFNDKQNFIVCRVIESLPADSISDGDWSSIEGYNVDFIKSISKSGYFQIHIKFICLLDDRGNMIFRDDIFSDNPLLPPPSQNKIEQKKEKKSMPVTNDDIFNLLNQINKNLEHLNKKKFFFDFLRKKTVYELLEQSGISGEVRYLNDQNYEVINDTKIYLIKLKTGLFSNKIEILLIKDKV